MKIPTFIKLSAITSKGAQAIREYGDIWKIQGKVENPRPDWFQGRKNQLYITPSPKPSRNPKEDIGDNYVAPAQVPGLGSRWINEVNDPDFEYEEHSFRRAA